MKNYVLVAILFGAALLGYNMRIKPINSHEIQKTIDAAQLEKQKILEEQEKKRDEAIELKARELTKTTLSTLTYDTAKGEKCTENCQDTNAGFEWAKSQDFNETSDCGGKTEAYKNGCQVYVDKYDNLLDENKEKLEALEIAKQSQQ
ncbi:MAG: hypothetical protein J0L55_05585 [Caulobacterales bacterium]|nr:hypothetical protein [Caulobacterales bacterium]MCA0372590.1 hypothetical protein [Pseudomonadota bacterium]